VGVWANEKALLLLRTALHTVRLVRKRSSAAHLGALSALVFRCLPNEVFSGAQALGTFDTSNRRKQWH
jgi:hypothetical protein